MVADPRVTGHPLAIALSAAVPLAVAELVRKGGPSNDDWVMAREAGQQLAEHGDNLLYRGKPGESARLFNTVAHALAVLAFCPGGVTFCGEHWEAVVDG